MTCKRLTNFAFFTAFLVVDCSTEIVISLLTCWWHRSIKRHKSNKWREAWPPLLWTLIEVYLASLSFSYEIKFSSVKVRRSWRDADISSVISFRFAFQQGDRRNSNLPKRKNGGCAGRAVLFLSLPPLSPVSANVYEVSGFFCSAGGWGTILFYLGLDYKTTGMDFSSGPSSIEVSWPLFSSDKQ